MATTGVVNGTLVLIDMEGHAIAYSKSATLTIEHETRDTTTKDASGWKHSAEGRRSWGMDVEGLVALDSQYNLDYLVGYIKGRTALTMKFTTGVSGDKQASGEGYLTNVEVEAGDQESVSFSASVEGSGELQWGAI